MWLFATPWTACQASLFFTVSLRLLKLTSIDSVMLSNHLIFCRTFFSLPSIFSSMRVFFSQLALLIRWLKHWSFSFSICPLKEHPRLISFRIDWLISLLSKGLSRVFSRTTVQKHQYEKHHSMKRQNTGGQFPIELSLCVTFLKLLHILIIVLLWYHCKTHVKQRTLFTTGDVLRLIMVRNQHSAENSIYYLYRILAVFPQKGIPVLHKAPVSFPFKTMSRKRNAKLNTFYSREKKE